MNLIFLKLKLSLSVFKLLNFYFSLFSVLEKESKTNN